jgi:hypothetical protein
MLWFCTGTGAAIGMPLQSQGHGSTWHPWHKIETPPIYFFADLDANPDLFLGGLRSLQAAGRI